MRARDMTGSATGNGPGSGPGIGAVIGEMIDALWQRVRALGSSFRSTEVHDVRGFRVVVENPYPEIDTASVLRRLDDALGLIERYQPWRLRHLREDARQFWVVRYPCRGAYFPGARTVMTELTFLARTDITAATVASSIVHEGIHARVDRMRTYLRAVSTRADPIPPTPDMPREERLCRRAELAFGRALPPALGTPVIARAAATLSLEDEEVAPTIDWTEAMSRVSVADAASRRGISAE